MNIDELIEKVITWGREKGINNPPMQLCKTLEELGEAASELTRGHYDSPELEDAYGDTLVCLIILADITGKDIRKCLELAYNEIKDRQGKIIDGSFVKDVK